MNDEYGFCEFCGKEEKYRASTSFQSNYCLHCLMLLRSEVNEAIKLLKAEMKKDKYNIPRQTITKEKLADLEKEKDEAFAKLINGKFRKN